MQLCSGVMQTRVLQFDTYSRKLALAGKIIKDCMGAHTFDLCGACTGEVTMHQPACRRPVNLKRASTLF